MSIHRSRQDLNQGTSVGLFGFLSLFFSERFDIHFLAEEGAALTSSTSTVLLVREEKRIPHTGRSSFPFVSVSVTTDESSKTQNGSVIFFFGFLLLPL
jgi:hypothetical protein